MNPTAWILSVSESKYNYWATYVVDLALMSYFLAWDIWHHSVRGSFILPLFIAGALIWTLTEYAFHRWVYHLGFELTRSGHDKHHEDPKATIAMPWFVTPILFVPPQLLIVWYFGVSGFSTVLSGWFAGFIAYSFMHHSLHHYKLPFAWYRHLQSQHRIHHAFPETNYGVTMRYWDRVFGTEFTKGSTPRSEHH